MYTFIACFSSFCLPIPPVYIITEHRAELIAVTPPASYSLSVLHVASPGGSEVKESTCSIGDLGSVPGLGRPLGEGNGDPLQYSCLGNSMDRGAWQATVHGVAKSGT